MRRADRPAVAVAVGRDAVRLSTADGAAAAVTGEDLNRWWRAFDRAQRAPTPPVAENSDRAQDRLVMPVGPLRQIAPGIWEAGLAPAAQAADRAMRVGVPTSMVARALVEALADQLAMWCRASQSVDPGRAVWEGEDLVRDRRFRDRVRHPAGACDESGGRIEA